MFPIQVRKPIWNNHNFAIGRCYEFQQYLDTKGKLKVVRTEALRSGVQATAGKKRTTSRFSEIAKRIPETVIQEDPAATDVLR